MTTNFGRDVVVLWKPRFVGTQNRTWVDVWHSVRAPQSNKPTHHLWNKILTKKPFHNKLAARVHAPTTPLQTLGVSALIRRFHNGVCERRAYPMRGGGLQAPFSCLARLAHCLFWLLSCCCSTVPHRYTTPKSQMSNYGSEVSSIYRKPMLGTQRDVTADKTSFDNNGLLVLVYIRTKTKSKDQVSKKTLRAQHLCGSGGKSRAKKIEVDDSW